MRALELLALAAGLVFAWWTLTPGFQESMRAPIPLAAAVSVWVVVSAGVLRVAQICVGGVG